MKWNQLTDVNQLTDILKNSHVKAQVIFKHSTRCSISNIALNRFKNVDNPENIDFYLLDLIKHRLLSNTIAEVFKVHHESPQVLMIVNNDCIYEESHLSISADDLFEQVPA